LTVADLKLAPTGETRYLEPIAGLFAGFLLISNLASTRLIQVGVLQFDAGTLMFPLTYIFGDLLTEVYGFAKSRKIIWTGFITLALATLLLYITSLFPAAPGWENDQAWHAVMGLVPRVALASFAAYLVGEFANSITLAKMKAKRPDQGPAKRFVVSTLVGQFFDTILFCCVAFLGVIDFELWLKLLGSNYVFKVGVEIILLPITVFVVRLLKKTEGLDPVDREISLSPFRWNEKPRPATPPAAKGSITDIETTAEGQGDAQSGEAPRSEVPKGEKRVEGSLDATPPDLSKDEATAESPSAPLRPKVDPVVGPNQDPNAAKAEESAENKADNQATITEAAAVADRTKETVKNQTGDLTKEDKGDGESN
jgi:uncharacterized integral membrane protein (TIGR00697 family)